MPTLKRRTYKQKRDKGYTVNYKKSKNWAEFYNDRRWKMLREWYITQHPICENCQLFGIITPAAHVHHRVPFRFGKNKEQKWELFLNADNLVSVCEECHHRIHNEINNTGIIPESVIPKQLEQ